MTHGELMKTRVWLAHYDPEAPYLPLVEDDGPDDVGCWSLLISEEDAASRFVGGSMKIYLAARFVDQDEAQILARKIEAWGHEVTSRWLNDSAQENADGVNFAFKALRDLEDIDRADVLLLNTRETETRTGGQFIEYGYAIAKGKPRLIFGPKPRTVFFALPHTLFAQSEQSLRALLEWGELLIVPAKKG